MKLIEFLEKIINSSLEDRDDLWDKMAELAHTEDFSIKDWVAVEPALSDLKKMIEAGIFEDFRKPKTPEKVTYTRTWTFPENSIGANVVEIGLSGPDQLQPVPPNADRTMDYEHVEQFLDEFCQRLIENSSGKGTITYEEMLEARNETVFLHLSLDNKVPPLAVDKDTIDPVIAAELKAAGKIQLKQWVDGNLVDCPDIPTNPQ